MSNSNNHWRQYFTDQELECPCCQVIPVTAVYQNFMHNVLEMRQDAKYPFNVGSGYRCPEYNDSLYGGDGDHLDGPHTKAAIDISVSYLEAYGLLCNAMKRNWGVGIRQHGDTKKRIVHMDPGPVRIWTYNAT